MKFSTFINRYLERSCLHFVSITILVVTSVALIIISLTPPNQKTIFGTGVGADYASLYIAGKILDEYQPNQLYDLEIQSDLYHALRPYVAVDKTLPYPYPPFLALPFWLLAKLPYVYSNLAWLLISLSLYMLGLTVILRSLQAIPRQYFLTCVLLALSFEPFIIECILGGQTSSLGFCAIALFFYLYQCRRFMFSGFALGLCLYKPTLLVVILPILLVSKQTRVLLGFALCGLMLTLISVLFFGLDTCVNWFEIAFGFAGAVGSEEVFKTYKYIDIVSFCRLLFGDLSQTFQILLACIWGAWFIIYLFLLRRFKVNNCYSHRLIFASILTWTTVFNIYFPIYDSIIIVLAVLLTVDTYYGQLKSVAEKLDLKLKVVLCLIYLTPVITQDLANHLKFQLYTLVLFGMGIYQLLILRRLSKETVQLSH
jgi:hypothetical protein